jgi:hypothetical protein
MWVDSSAQRTVRTLYSNVRKVADRMHILYCVQLRLAILLHCKLLSGLLVQHRRILLVFFKKGGINDVMDTV